MAGTQEDPRRLILAVFIPWVVGLGCGSVSEIADRATCAWDGLQPWAVPQALRDSGDPLPSCRFYIVLSLYMPEALMDDPLHKLESPPVQTHEPDRVAWQATYKGQTIEVGGRNYDIISDRRPYYVYRVECDGRRRRLHERALHADGRQDVVRLGFDFAIAVLDAEVAQQGASAAE